MNAQTASLDKVRGKNSVYLDLLVLIFYNNFQINYERTLISFYDMEFNARLGLGSWTNWGFTDVAVPYDLHYVYTKYKIHPEINAGGISFWDNSNDMLSMPRLLIGGAIRYQPYNYGFYFRLKVEYLKEPSYTIMPGFSFGWNF